MFPAFWLLVFVIIAFFLICRSISSLLDYRRTKDRNDLYEARRIWYLPLSLIIGVNFLVWFFADVSVDRERIIGSYEVDDSFFPGKNASWQKKHFRFEIREDDTFVLFERLADDTEKEYHGTVSWGGGLYAVERWSVSMDDPHHVVDPFPTLYRGQFDFYYVFESQKFGNMFFRKMKWYQW